MNIGKIDAFVFDFDGVLTNNRVWVNQDGLESVCCNRGDGLAFDVLKKLKIPAFILSTEINPVVVVRAQKLKIPVLNGIANKKKALQKLCKENDFNLENILFIGNDLNDFEVMSSCGYSACPSDAHAKIKGISTKVLVSRGGECVARELLEKIFKINFLKVLYDIN